MSSPLPTQTIGIDWSGDRTAAGQRRAIWCAVVRDGELVELEHGRTREEVLAHAVALAGGHAGPTAIGLDFAFGLPAWWVSEAGVDDVWAWARERRETLGPTWTDGLEAPFWGSPVVAVGRSSTQRGLSSRSGRDRSSPSDQRAVRRTGA